MKSSQARTWLILIVLFAICLRLVYSFVVFPKIANTFNWYLDDGFDELAWNVVQGNGYVFEPGFPPAVQRPPGYPAFLIPIYFFFGKANWMVQLVQSIMGGLTIIPLFYLGRKFFGDKGALLGAFFFSIHLQSILYTARLFTETLFTLILILFVMLLVKLFTRPTLLVSVASGITLGLLTLIRSNMLLFGPVLVLVLCILFFRQRRSALLNSAALLAGMLLLVGTWAYRNYLVTGDFIPVSTLGGQVFYVGNVLAKDEQGNLHSAAENYWQNYLNEESFRITSDGNTDGPVNLRNVPNEAQRDNFLYRYTLRWAAENPGLFLLGLVKKTAYFWYLATTGPTNTILSVISQIPFVLTGIAGFVMAIRRRLHVLPFLLLILFTNLSFAFYWAQVRYSTPVMPLIMLFSAYFLLEIPPLRRLVDKLIPERIGYQYVAQ